MSRDKIFRLDESRAESSPGAGIVFTVCSLWDEPNRASRWVSEPPNRGRIVKKRWPGCGGIRTQSDAKIWNQRSLRARRWSGASNQKAVRAASRSEAVSRRKKVGMAG